MAIFRFTIEADLSPTAKEWIMSKISDAIAAVQASLNAATTRVLVDVKALHDKIDALQALVDAGGASQADLDNLAALQAQADAIDPTSPVTLPG